MRSTFDGESNPKREVFNVRQQKNSCNYSSLKKMEDLRAKLDLYSGKELERRKTWYSDVAQAYDRTRPHYPRKTIDRLITLTSLDRNSQVLEVGCGPATATISFTPLDCPILCLEPNPDFYRLAKLNCQAYPQVEIINTSLEEWQEEKARFDVAVSATAFHWIPPEIGLPKIASALQENGYFILLWNGQLLPKVEVAESLVEIYQKYAPSLATYEDIATQRKNLFNLGNNLQDSALFTPPIYEEEIINTTYTIADYLLLLSTYSPYIALDVENRQALFTSLHDRLERDWGSHLELSYISAFHLSRKIKDSTP
jgi:SAM-dependent methyltransferase